jgi:fatty acid desaturase
MTLTQLPTESDAYVAGTCNIGPEEIARRRMFGHLALGASLVLLAGLVGSHAPAWTRLVLFFPVAGSATGYIQARSHFCANFGSRGVYNFGAPGTENRVTSEEDRARDRARSLRIAGQSAAIGLVAAVVAVLLPF